jgi:alpha-mannosidase
VQEYPEYRFVNSQPHLYRMVKQRYPQLYQRIRRAVRSGTIVPEGGMWVEADTNISGGEALVRQFIHGMRFFREEFGVGNEMLWLPDVFGYSGALPQIIRGCGLKYFGTAKIFWIYNGGDPFPYNTFTWKGIDGTGVLVHLFDGYGTHTYPANMIGQWKALRSKEGLSGRPVAFGYGDGGSGANRDHLELLRRQRNLEGVPHVRMASPVEYYHDQERRGIPDKTYVGELYYQCHRGTYTSQARTKKGNRQSELALREAELWGCAARALKGRKFGPQVLDEAWKRVLLCQFHDVLPGSSIRRVYQEAEAMHREVIAEAQEVAGRARAAFTRSRKGAVTVFNSLSWERRALVALPRAVTGLVDMEGKAVAVQRIAGTTYAEVRVPPCGWTSLRTGKRVRGQDDGLSASVRTIENRFCRLRINPSGAVSSIYDKQSRRELAAGVCNQLRMYKDVPSKFDAWDVESMYKDNPVALTGRAEVRVVSKGPVAAVLRVKRRLCHSTMVQDIIVHRDSRRIDFKTRIDWQESHKLLKVDFPVDIHTDEGIHEIQFGHIRRPNHASRPFDADRFEVSNHKWTAVAEEGRGCAVLNDCKYGVNVCANSINLTLLRSPVAPDHGGDRGVHEFTYSFYSWNGSLADSGLVREGYELNVPASAVEGWAGTASLLSLDSPNIVVEAVKPAEDGSRDLIVRLYESMRSATRCTLSTSVSIAGAVECDMLEGRGKRLRARGGRISLQFRPFEIKTIRLAVKR